MSDYDYAVGVATALWERHYQTSAPDWKPLDTLIGVLTQIDNMIAGLPAVRAYPRLVTALRATYNREPLHCTKAGVLLRELGESPTEATAK